MKKSEPTPILSATQEKFLAALLVHPTIKQAAAECKITVRTAQNYLATPVFAKAYAEARRGVLEETKNGLTALVQLSLETLEVVLRDETVQPSMRLKAVEMVFTRVLDTAPATDPGAETGQTRMLMIDPEALEHMTAEEKDVLLGLLKSANERKITSSVA